MPADLPYRELNDGNVLPAIGFGTAGLKGPDGVDAMVSALDAGYRLLDSAVNYENEEEVGEALRRSGVPREDVQVTTKIPGRFHEHDLAVQSVEDSLRRLRLQYLDLCLIHWPNPSVGRYRDAWRALVEVQRRGLVRSIGVSNFTEQHLRDVIDDSGVTPSVNQIELHPYFPQETMRQVHASLGVVTESWSPLAHRNPPFREAAVADAAAEHGVSPAQVVLRWHVQLGALPLPKSATPARQAENLELGGFELSQAQLDAISGLGHADGRLFDGDPETRVEL